MNFPPPTEKQARLIWAAVSGLAVAVIVGLVVVLVWGLGRVLGVVGPVVWPLAVAGVLAYLLDPVVDFIERRRVPRARAVGLVFALALVLIVGLCGSVVPQVVVEIKQLGSQIPDYARKVELKVQEWIKHPPAGLGRAIGRYLPGRAAQTSGGVTSTSDSTNAPAWTNLDVAERGPPGPQQGPASVTAAPDGGVRAAPPGPGGDSPAQRPDGGGQTAVGTNVWLQVQVLGGATNAVVLAVPAPGPGPDAAAGGATLLDTLFTLDNVKTAGSFISKAASAIGAWVVGQAGKVTSLFGVVFGVLAGLALVPIYLFYFLIEKRGIASNWTAYLPVQDSAFKEELVFVLRSINDYLIAFFRGQVLVAICDGILYTIGFSLIGLPYAVLIGVMATILTIIPFLGAIATVAVALVVALVQFGDWQHPLLVLAVFGVVQGLEGAIIQPKIMGDRVGLHPVVIIVALMVGTTLLGGILGGILAIPLAAALRVVMFRYVWKPHDAAPRPSGREGEAEPPGE